MIPFLNTMGRGLSWTLTDKEGMLIPITREIHQSKNIYNSLTGSAMQNPKYAYSTDETYWKINIIDGIAFCFSQKDARKDSQ